MKSRLGIPFWHEILVGHPLWNEVPVGNYLPLKIPFGHTFLIYIFKLLVEKPISSSHSFHQSTFNIYPLLHILFGWRYLGVRKIIHLVDCPYGASSSSLVPILVSNISCWHNTETHLALDSWKSHIQQCNIRMEKQHDNQLFSHLTFTNIVPFLLPHIWPNKELTSLSFFLFPYIKS